MTAPATGARCGPRDDGAGYARSETGPVDLASGNCCLRSRIRTNKNLGRVRRVTTGRGVVRWAFEKAAGCTERLDSGPPGGEMNSDGEREERSDVLYLRPAQSLLEQDVAVALFLLRSLGAGVIVPARIGEQWF